jgi:hypothetical protein
MCAALAYLPINTVVDSWLMITENVPQNENSMLFLHYFVEQWLKKSNVPIEMWNINKHGHMVEGGIPK